MNRRDKDILEKMLRYCVDYGEMNAEQTWHISHIDITELKQFLRKMIEESD